MSLGLLDLGMDVLSLPVENHSEGLEQCFGVQIVSVVCPVLTKEYRRRKAMSPQSDTEPSLCSVMGQSQPQSVTGMSGYPVSAHRKDISAQKKKIKRTKDHILSANQIARITDQKSACFFSP